MRLRGWAVVLAVAALPAVAQQGEAPRSGDTQGGAETFRPAERDELLAHVQKAMEELGAAVDELRRRADKATDDAQASLDQQLRALQEEQKKLERRLQELKAITAQQWRQLQDDIDRALQRYRQTEPKPRKEAI